MNFSARERVHDAGARVAVAAGRFDVERVLGERPPDPVRRRSGGARRFEQRGDGGGVRRGGRSAEEVANRARWSR